MSAVLKQRARITRVRRLQHDLAAAAAAAAGAKVQSLELNNVKLARMRGELRVAGSVDGAALARAGELGMRLDSARLGLGRSIDQARALADARERARLAARRSQESAEKIEQAAHGACAQMADRKAQARPHRGRRMTNWGDQDT